MTTNNNFLDKCKQIQDLIISHLEVPRSNFTFPKTFATHADIKPLTQKKVIIHKHIHIKKGTNLFPLNVIGDWIK